MRRQRPGDGEAMIAAGIARLVLASRVQAMVEDRRTDLTLEQIERAATELEGLGWGE